MKSRSRSMMARRSGSTASGFVLVTVLIVLSLLVILVVAFLLRVTTEQSSSTGFRGSASARDMADMAVGLIQGEINLATTQEPTNVWCSQPGMVRTYQPDGTLYNAFKLYSSTNMVLTSSAQLNILNGVSPDVAPANWASSPAIWTDLNSPMQSPSGTNVYPIVDPGATNTTLGPSGFSIANAPGATTAQPFPMPVQWLYVLADGSLVAPVVSGSSITIAGANSTDKKIVGRIAFWTDDNTCRVNINTASAGTFWDVPRAYTKLPAANGGIPTSGSLTQEQAFGYYQPVQKEFQRYPGHPAMTDLRAVFPNATPAQIYNIVPRVVGGGSTQGTVALSAGSFLTNYPNTMPNSRLYADVDELLFKGDHTTLNTPLVTTTQLQASKFFLTAQSRAPEVNLFGLPRVACWPVNADYDPVANPQSHYASAFDRLIAFCSTTGSTSISGAYHPYYFQRKDALNPTTDISIARNQAVYKYLHYLTGQSIPGFSSNSPSSFQAKYPSPDGKLPTDGDQILTEIFDYVRATNLYDTTLDITGTTGIYEYTGTGVTGLVAKGYVVPSVVSPTINGEGTSSTVGFGRAYTVSNLGIGFICNADGNTDSTGYYAASNAITNSTSASPPQYINKVLGGTKLSSGQKYVQAIVMPEFFSPMYGFTSMWPNLQVSVSGLRSLYVTGADGNPAYLFPNDVEPTASDGPLYYHDLRADSASTTTGAGPWSTVNNMFGGNPQWRYFSMGQVLNNITSSGQGRAAPARGNLAADTTYEPYPLIGTPVIITDNDTGTPPGTMVFSGGEIVVTLSDHSGNAIQKINVKLPQASFPTPKLVTLGTPVNGAYPATTPYNWWSFNRGGGTTNPSNGQGRLYFAGKPPTASGALTANGSSNVLVSGSPSTDYFSGLLLRPDFDVLRTLSPTHGDYRLVAGSANVPDTVFQPERYYYDMTQMFASTFTDTTRGTYEPGYDTSGQYLSYVSSASYQQPDISYAASTNSPPLTPEATLDYDNPLPDMYPGPYVNKPNEGSDRTIASNGSTVAQSIPYYSSSWQTTANGQGVDTSSDQGAFFSPNRMMPSPGMFGSLPTGVEAGVPWRTLLFRPQSGHYGATNPPDHLLLDLFWMPVVEPYAISDRFSTAGKINMNYQILPFTYMTRSTGLNALFQSEMVTAIPNTEASAYKTVGTGTTKVLRNQIDTAQTLSQFTSKFSTGDAFKSASEICTLEIVPDGGAAGTTPGVNTVSGMPTYWKNNAITGENVREGIYARLYPRLTTKSNTYTVYFTAQSLKQTSSSTPGTWTEGTDTIQGEYRGSAVIERFIDANNGSIPDYASDISTSGNLPVGDQPLDTFYRWRIISNRQFAP